MSTEVFLSGVSLVVALIAFIYIGLVTSRNRRPTYHPVRVPVTRRLPNTAAITRPDHIL